MANLVEDKDNGFNKVRKSQKVRLLIWEFVKYFIAIINTVAAVASIVGLFISIVTKEKMAIVF